MPSLAELHQQLETRDEELTKIAAEEEAAGRIMARGFTDELNKLAAGSSYGVERTPPNTTGAPKTGPGTMPGGLQATTPPKTGGGAVGAPKIDTGAGAARAMKAGVPTLPKHEPKTPS